VMDETSLEGCCARWPLWTGSTQLRSAFRQQVAGPPGRGFRGDRSGVRRGRRGRRRGTGC
jgi:hypothetical protein